MSPIDIEKGTRKTRRTHEVKESLLERRLGDTGMKLNKTHLMGTRREGIMRARFCVAQR